MLAEVEIQRTFLVGFDPLPSSSGRHEVLGWDSVLWRSKKKNLPKNLSGVARGMYFKNPELKKHPTKIWAQVV